MSSHLRDFGLVLSSIWQSEKFLALQTHEARLAYIWLHTGQKTCAGVLRIGPAHMADELVFIADMEAAEKIFDDLERVGLIVRQRPFVIVTQFVKATPVKSYKHAIAAFKECLSLPDCPAKQDLFAELKRQAGAAKLAEWRDKNGEPHNVLFDIHAYAESPADAPDETPLNPMDTLSKPIGKGSGKPKPRKEKEERRRAASGQGASDFQSVAHAFSAGHAENGDKPQGPHPETIAAAKRLEALR